MVAPTARADASQFHIIQPVCMANQHHRDSLESVVEPLYYGHMGTTYTVEPLYYGHMGTTGWNLSTMDTLGPQKPSKIGRFPYYGA